MNILELRPLTDWGFAAELRGVDTTDRNEFGRLAAAIAAAFEEYSVLVFRGADLSDEGLLSLASSFAQQFPGASVESSPPGRPLVQVANFDLGTGMILARRSQLRRFRTGNGFWHADSSYKMLPALASLLLARELPPP